MRHKDVTESDIARWIEVLLKEEGGVNDEITKELYFATYWIEEQLADMSLSREQLNSISFSFGQRISATSEWQYAPYEREDGCLYGPFQLGPIKVNRRHNVHNIWMLAEWVLDRARQGVFDTPGEDLAMALTFEFSANLLQMRKAIKDAQADILKQEQAAANN